MKRYIGWARKHQSLMGVWRPRTYAYEDREDVKRDLARGTYYDLAADRPREGWSTVILPEGTCPMAGK